MTSETPRHRAASSGFPYGLVITVAALIVGIIAWQGVMSLPNRTVRSTTTAAAVDIGTLALATITASMVGATQACWRPIGIVTDLGEKVPALQLQAIPTGSEGS